MEESRIIPSTHNMPPELRQKALIYLLIKENKKYPTQMGFIYLNKALWAVDVCHAVMHGYAFAWEEYYVKKHGASANGNLHKYLAELEDEGMIKIVEPCFPFDVRKFEDVAPESSCFYDVLREDLEKLADMAIRIVTGYSEGLLGEHGFRDFLKRYEQDSVITTKQFAIDIQPLVDEAERMNHEIDEDVRMGSEPPSEEELHNT